MPHKLSIIGLSGKLGSGKDECAKRLVKHHNFSQIALADPMKRFIKDLFDFSDKQLWGPSHYRNDIDSDYSSSVPWDRAKERLEILGLDFCKTLVTQDKLESTHNALVHWFHWLRNNHTGTLSPRVALQSLGTEFGRNDVDKDVWVRILLETAKKLLHEDGNIEAVDYSPVEGVIEVKKAKIKGVVVSDVRFENEFQAVRDCGGSIIRVVRPETDDLADSVGIVGHESEASVIPLDHFDFMLVNDKSLVELNENLDKYMDIFFSVYH